jgi:hypothetical protein
MDVQNKVASTMNNIVGPIGHEYCVYFYILSVLAIFFFLAMLVAIVYTGISKKMGPSFFVLSILYSSQLLLAYLQNRLLYNMCSKSI